MINSILEKICQGYDLQKEEIDLIFSLMMKGETKLSNLNLFLFFIILCKAIEISFTNVQSLKVLNELVFIIFLFFDAFNQF